MEKKQNELVFRLTVKQGVECFRPQKTAQALKQCIDRNYVHVLFKETGTELGIKLNSNFCDFTDASFENASGKIHMEGGVTLNYDKVKCIAEIDLSTCEGTGYLEPLSDEEYESFMK